MVAEDLSPTDVNDMDRRILAGERALARTVRLPARLARKLLDDRGDRRAAEAACRQAEWEAERLRDHLAAMKDRLGAMQRENERLREAVEGERQQAAALRVQLARVDRGLFPPGAP